MVDTFKTSKIDEQKIEAKVKEVFDTSPAGIVKTLDLKRPIYKKTSAYGHFGRRDPDFNWEQTDKAEVLKSLD
jgi:S-adenosylmethionine synthetase